MLSAYEDTLPSVNGKMYMSLNKDLAKI